MPENSSWQEILTTALEILRECVDGENHNGGNRTTGWEEGITVVIESTNLAES